MKKGATDSVDTSHLVKLTDHFEHNLADIEAFLWDAGTPAAFDDLLDELTETVIPNLARFPALGQVFLTRRTGSIETINGIASLTRQLNAIGQRTELREYVMSTYLLLYAQIDSTVYLLSIRHQRQLSLDFQALWQRT